MAKKPTDLTLREYEDNAHKTISNSTSDYLEQVLTAELVGILRRFVDLSRSIDNYKKAAFYGRNIETFPQPLKPMDRKGIPFQLFHGVLGMAGESGEVVELLLNVLEGRMTMEEATPLLKAELGDNLWYLTVGARAVDAEGGLEAVAVGNNKKLEDRWGDKIEAGKTDFKS